MKKNSCDSGKAKCMEHLNAFLKKCEHNPAMISWTMVELQKHFPLDEWECMLAASQFIQN